MRFPKAFLIFGAIFKLVAGGQVLQITDFHYDKDYNRYGDINKACHLDANATPGEDIGEFGNYICDSPQVRQKLKETSKKSYFLVPGYKRCGKCQENHSRPRFHSMDRRQCASY